MKARWAGALLPVLFVVSATKDLTYSPSRLEASAGAEVTITLRNDSALDHNLVVARPGTENDVAASGREAGRDKGFQPPESAGLVAKLGPVKPGQSAAVTFKAPDTPGDYPFVCTFPGHARMRGILVVR